MKYWIAILGIFLMFSACNDCEKGCLINDFNDYEKINVVDSIDLDELGILNPHYIQYKDSFLIFNSIQGLKEMQFLDLKTMAVYSHNVIGQGENEMAGYSTVNNHTISSYRFADYRRGKIYDMNLDSLRINPVTKHSLVHSLPIDKDEHLLRFIETDDRIYGIGLLRTGRIWSFDKQSSVIKRNAQYPVNEFVDRLDAMHKGALYSSTLMVGDIQGKYLVTSCFGLIDFYEISSENQLKLKRECHYFFPSFNSQESGQAIIFKRDDIYGFSEIDSDNSFVYLLYSGKNMKDTGRMPITVLIYLFMIGPVNLLNIICCRNLCMDWVFMGILCMD